MQASPSSRWQFWIDRGGTFTDIVAKTPDGQLLAHKLLSENPEQYEDAAVAGVRHFLGLAAHEFIRADQVACVKMGTTVATNALLERKGEPTLLLTTQGFRDALRIGYQTRPRLFDRCITLPELLYSQVVEAEERISAQGEVLTKLNVSQLERDLRAAFDQGLRSIAIVFMHGYRFHEHEKAAALLAQRIGFTQISTSHQTSPLMKFVSRGDTTVVDAYLSPILRRYIDRVAEQMPGVALFFMQSSGGLTDATLFQGKDAILSGPAGGIVGMARTAEMEGEGRVIGFDMGGTSTDVSHYAGQFEREFETLVAGVRMRTPILNIHTVAAGGGSILQFDGARLRVGPQSAGADPGPACYRRGGPLTITDANVLLGKIQAQYFPKVFGKHANEALDEVSVREQFIQLANACDQDLYKVAEGFIHIAVQQMANAIKKISVARGYDVTRYTLQCFGGAGGQHACLVADALGIERILIHPFAGVLSAYGMGLADQSAMREQSVELLLHENAMPQVQQIFAQLEDKIYADLAAQQAIHNSNPSAMKLHKRVHLRYQDSDTALIVAYSDLAHMKTHFEALYQQRFAYIMPEKSLVIEAVSIEAVIAGEQVVLPRTSIESDGSAPVADVRFYSAGQFHAARLFDRSLLGVNTVIQGPAIIQDANATTIVEPHWQVQVTPTQNLVLIRNHALKHCAKSFYQSQQQSTNSHHTPPSQAQMDPCVQVDPIRLEVFNHLFMNIAEQMGLQLQNTAHSVNIKERLDFSCALFDRKGELIANAPHMPVHLGSMGESIKTIMDANAQTMKPGDVYMLNAPYHGGTHLPDITVITPVFLKRDVHAPLFYVASRGHHTDIGGMTPGSMPPFSKHIDEEGVKIINFKLIDAGTFRESETLALLTSGHYPSRNPQQNIADLQAQIAANEKGVQELLQMVETFGQSVVEAYMQHVKDNAEASVRKVIGKLKSGQFCVSLDNGAQIKVSIRIDTENQSAAIDFSGSSAQLTNNFNAPRAVSIAAVLYVFRCLVEDDIPLNAGCLKPLEIIIPEGSMLNPVAPAAVVAGNVETSMCITNALFGALGVLASSQPTMNNFAFGNVRYQYYETISGGSGAGGLFDENGECYAGFHGTSVVQTHMTNSRLTDPEVLEFRYPVRLESYAIRDNSGGRGRYWGGNGSVRRIRFLEAMSASILSNGRVHPAFGLAGGSSGALGINRVIRSDNQVEQLAHIAQVDMLPGDIFEIHTPGGGGFGQE